ncbi:MAG: FtsQ-type POTRA domain-containing protein [Treponema sp.]|nr:FtsQ-type POTRA domain-containing protein [Treponema sp.]
MSDLSIQFTDYEDDDFFGAKKSDFIPAMQREAKQDKLITVLKVVFVVLALCVAGEFAYYKFLKPSLEYPVVSVSGTENYSAGEIVDVLRPMNVANWFDFDADKAVAIIASMPGIDTVSVRKSFPNKIYIEVAERTPVASTFIVNNGHSVPVQIDRNGYIFPERKGDAENASMPIISGLPVEHYSDGMRLPSKYRPLIEQIYNIQKLPQKYLAAVSEICVVPKEYGNYELVLIPVASKVRVLTDRSLNEDSLKYMMIALDVVNKIEPDAGEIDLRYGSVSYRK